MARYTGPVCRLCRRSGEKLFLKGERCFTPKCAIERRPNPPGQRSPRRRKMSDRGLQLREKQKARQTYGLLERQFRRLWIIRINAAARLHGLPYGQLINGIRRAGIEIDRKQLAELAVNDDAAFAKIVETARAAIAA